MYFMYKDEFQVKRSQNHIRLWIMRLILNIIFGSMIIINPSPHFVLLHGQYVMN